jgi:hypothetical protein
MFMGLPDESNFDSAIIERRRSLFGLNFGSKAEGFFCWIIAMVLVRVGLSVLFRQLSQLQS